MDGSSQSSTGASPDALERATALVAGAARIAVLTGAGISTAAGIPDFRGPDGVWTRDPAAERASTIGHYLADGETRRRAWQRRLRLVEMAPQPTAAHRALVDLERRGVLVGLATQNIDGLHHDAGSDPALVHEVHGTGRVAHCVRCRAEWPIGVVIDRVRAGEDDPPCSECGGIVKPAVVFFGEALPPGRLEAALRAAAQCDVLVAVGTTLAVGPINRMVVTAARSGAAVIIVNGSPTEMDDLAAVIVTGDIQHTLPAVLGVGPRGDSRPTG